MKLDFKRKIPEGDDRARRICRTCGFIDYENPKLVAGAVAADSAGRLLLCKRAIEPRKGYWTLPAGFMEQGESVEAAAAREAYEQARARLALGPLLAVYSIPRISQVQMFFTARLIEDAVAAGPESQEVALYDWADLPMNDLAFPSVRWALEDWRAVRKGEAAAPIMRTQGEDGAPV